MNLEEKLNLLTRGVSDLISEEELKKKLKESEEKGKPLKVKLGLDPTAPDIHLGHTVVLRKMRQFQDMGHEVYLVIGDYTARIGDPTGKSETRKQLTEEEIMENAQTYKEQFSRVLDPEKTNLVFNSEWLSELDLLEIIDLSSNYTVARMLEREDFSNRYDNNLPISLHEFFYPIMQGYDSVAIEADIELGGTDQRFNLLVGRKLQSEYNQDSQILMMMPLLEGLDGVKKMSKSLDNYIGVFDTANDMYGKIMSLPDHLISRYFELLTDIPFKELEKIKGRLDSEDVNPMKFKKKLAEEIVSEYHSRDEAKEAAEEFARVFSGGELPDDMPVIELGEDQLEDGEIWIVKLVAATGHVDSNSQARRMIKQGAVYIDGERHDKINHDLKVEDGMIVKIGKRRYAEVKLEG
jgi:tyrosyl-tRNA synthetase